MLRLARRTTTSGGTPDRGPADLPRGELMLALPSLTAGPPALLHGGARRPCAPYWWGHSQSDLSSRRPGRPVHLQPLGQNNFRIYEERATTVGNIPDRGPAPSAYVVHSPFQQSGRCWYWMTGGMPICYRHWIRRGSSTHEHNIQSYGRTPETAPGGSGMCREDRTPSSSQRALVLCPALQRSPR